MQFIIKNYGARPNHRPKMKNFSRKCKLKVLFSLFFGTMAQRVVIASKNPVKAAAAQAAFAVVFPAGQFEFIPGQSGFDGFIASANIAMPVPAGQSHSRLLLISWNKINTHPQLMWPAVYRISPWVAAKHCKEHSIVSQMPWWRFEPHLK